MAIMENTETALPTRGFTHFIDFEDYPKIYAYRPAGIVRSQTHELYVEVSEWLYDNVKTEDYDVYRSTIGFVNEEDAVAFKMRWG